GAAFEDVQYMPFLLSAAAVRWSFRSLSHGKLIGGMIYEAVRDTHELVGTNTNLGVILLLAPLLAAPEQYDLRTGVSYKLERLARRDAELVYAAIRLANPGGLGEVPEQDVRSEPTVTLLEAMKLAADRHMVAPQYANGFADVFDFGVPAFLDAFARFGCVEAAVIDSQLRWLATYPDSLIARKNGPAIAEDVRRRAAEGQQLGGIATAEG